MWNKIKHGNKRIGQVSYEKQVSCQKIKVGFLDRGGCPEEGLVSREWRKGIPSEGTARMEKHGYGDAECEEST